MMRKRGEIQVDGTRKEDLVIECLLDIRDLLAKMTKKEKQRRKRKESKVR